MSTVEKTVFLYGDESYASEIVTYGFVIIPTQNIASVESALKEVKTRHGLPEDVGIHCRNLFNKKARTKTAFAKFSTNEMFRFLDELMTASFVAGARGWVGYLDTQKAPDALLFASDGRTGIDRWDVSDLKNRMMFCYQAASAPLMHIFPPSRVKAFVDGDRTKIPHFEKRRKVDSLRSFFPVEHNNIKFFPEAVHGLKPSPLDLADLLAYAAARGLSKAALMNKSLFVSIVEAIDPGYSEVIFERPSASGAMFKIRAYDPADRVKSYVNQFL
jgi:hypothetical protein